MAKILLVEDDRDLGESLRQWLRQEGYSVEVFESAEEALEVLAYSEFDVIIVDWNLPGVTGVELVSRYRKKGGSAMVMFLTGKSDLNDKVVGFDSGADDYLTKPFKMREVSARLRAMLRRHKAVSEGELRFADLVLDSSLRTVRRGEEILKLPPRDFGVLEFLLRKPNETFSTAQLLRHVWSSDSDATDQTVRTCVKRLRQAIDRPNQPSYIENSHGHGYRLNRALLDNKPNE